MKKWKKKKAVQKKVVLSLYVAGATSQSRGAITKIKKILQEHLPDVYKLSIVDIYQDPGLAKKKQIIAVPTLIKEAPEPVRLFIGDLQEFKSVLDTMTAT